MPHFRKSRKTSTYKGRPPAPPIHILERGGRGLGGGRPPLCRWSGPLAAAWRPARRIPGLAGRLCLRAPPTRGEGRVASKKGRRLFAVYLFCAAVFSRPPSLPRADSLSLVHASCPCQRARDQPGTSPATHPLLHVKLSAHPCSSLFPCLCLHSQHQRLTRAVGQTSLRPQTWHEGTRATSGPSQIVRPLLARPRYYGARKGKKGLRPRGCRKTPQGFQGIPGKGGRGPGVPHVWTPLDTVGHRHLTI